jgi:hypothetical protein
MRGAATKARLRGACAMDLVFVLAVVAFFGACELFVARGADRL